MIDIAELATQVAGRLGLGWESEPGPEPWSYVVLRGPDGLRILLSERDDQQISLLWFIPGEYQAGMPDAITPSKEIVIPLRRGASSIAAAINRQLLPAARHGMRVARYERARREELLRELAAALGIPPLRRSRNEIAFDQPGTHTPSVSVQLDEHHQMVHLSLAVPVSDAVRLARAVGQAIAAEGPTAMTDFEPD